MQSGNTGKMNILKHPHKLHKVLNNSLSFDCSNVQCVDRALFRGFLCVLCLLCICVCCYNISNKYNLICDGVKVICYSGVHFTSHAVFHQRKPQTNHNTCTLISVCTRNMGIIQKQNFWEYFILALLFFLIKYCYNNR